MGCMQAVLSFVKTQKSTQSPSGKARSAYSFAVI